ncbi:uncharacterized protein LOC143377477 [Andrena cerasifolii]|uniref:uncharacterized protein LOC143377477 n=1 Tax=Andrena cerasifolii TaxID=2819439 RepID=UPI0040380505
MLRSSHQRSSNLTQERGKKIARHLESSLPRARDPGTSQQKDPSKGSDVATKDASIAASTSKGTGTRLKKSTKSRVTDNRSVAVGLSAVDRPGTSRSQPREPLGPEQGSSKATEDKSIEMRGNLSAERLHGNEDIDDIDDDYSLAEEERRSKFVLVGWDRFRSKLMMVLLVLFILWAAIYFPLIGS